MAFQIGTVDFIVKELLPRLKNRGRVVSLARQRITCPPEDLKKYLDTAGFKTDSLDYAPGQTLTTRELFPALGFRHYDDIDFTPDEACTIVHDLNRPIPESLRHRYDLVFEMGTMEHIFDVRMTFDNIIRLVKIGGTVFHLAPLTFLNHGFYNFSFTIFYDVYRNNGFKNLTFFLVEFPYKWWKNPVTNYQPFEFTPDPIKLKIPKGYFLMAACIAEKERELPEFQVPIQAFYDQTLKDK